MLVAAFGAPGVCGDDAECIDKAEEQATTSLFEGRPGNNGEAVVYLPTDTIGVSGGPSVTFPGHLTADATRPPP